MKFTTEEYYQFCSIAVTNVYKPEMVQQLYDNLTPDIDLRKIPKKLLEKMVEYNRPYDIITLNNDPNMIHLCRLNNYGFNTIATKSIQKEICQSGISNDGCIVAVPKIDNSVEIINLATGYTTHISPKINLQNMINFVHFSPDNKKIVIVYFCSLIHIIDWTENQLLTEINKESETSDISFSPDNDMIATCELVRNSFTAECDIVIMIWSIESGKLLKRICDPDIAHSGICYSPNGKGIAYFCYNQSYVIKFLNLETNENTIMYVSEEKQNIDQFCFSPDGKEIIFLFGQNTICFRNIGSGENIICECLAITDLIEMKVVPNEKTKIHVNIENYLLQ